MALNKDLNYVAMNDNGAGKNYTNEEIEANKARAKAAGYGTAATGNSAYSDAYTKGQQAGNNFVNSLIRGGANISKNETMKLAERQQMFKPVSDWLGGLFGGGAVDPNKTAQVAAAYGQVAANPGLARSNAITPATPSDNVTAPGGNTTTMPSDSTPSNTNNAYSGYYDTERNYQQERLKQEREAAIQRARFAYQQAVNPYGVQAEALASSGLAANGGYGQRMQQARYNAYANAANAASNQYQSDVAALDRQLAYQKYSEELADKQNAYANAQNEYNTTNNLISGALAVGAKVANISGKKIKNEAEVIQYIKNVYPAIDDGAMQTVLAMLRSGK